MLVRLENRSFRHHKKRMAIVAGDRSDDVCLRWDMVVGAEQL